MDKKLNNIFKGDKVIWMVFFFLCIISVIEVYSASSELTYKDGSFLAPLLKHSALLLLGLAFMIVVLNIKCKYFKILTPFLIPFSMFMLLWVLLAGQSTNGAQRWIGFLGFQFQPSEIAKGTLVLATAQILSAMQTEHGADRRAIKYVCSVSALILPLIMVENLSTAFLLGVVVFLMMLIGRVPLKQLGVLIGGVLIGVVFIVGMVMLLGNDPQQSDPNKVLTEQVGGKEAEKPAARGGVLHRFDTWKARIDKFANKGQVPADSVDLFGKDAQAAHANIAIASSNIVGKMPGKSDERDFLSQAFSDFIFAIIIEETGLWGAFIVVMLYVILLFRTGRIANRCENNFPAFLAMGLALLLVTQALFNMCVAVGLVPVTGQPLPLISKGGTSTVINCIYVGAILSVSRSAQKKANLTAVDDDEMSEKVVVSTVNAG